MNVTGTSAPIRGAIFDIDGTLLDSLGIWNELGARYLRSLGIAPEPGLADALFPLTIEEGVRYLKTHYAIGKAEPDIRAGLTAQIDLFYEREVQMKPGMEDVLRMLRDAGIPMVLATIGEPSQEETALRRLGAWAYFRKMFVCEDYGTTKREALIYDIAARELGTSPEETLVFEDMLQAVETAKAAGYRTVAVADSEQAKDRKALQREAELFVEPESAAETLKRAFGL